MCARCCASAGGTDGKATASASEGFMVWLGRQMDNGNQPKFCDKHKLRWYRCKAWGVRGGGMGWSWRRDST